MVTCQNCKNSGLCPANKSFLTGILIRVQGTLASSTGNDKRGLTTSGVSQTDRGAADCPQAIGDSGYTDPDDHAPVHMDSRDQIAFSSDTRDTSTDGNRSRP